MTDTSSRPTRRIDPFHPDAIASDPHRYGKQAHTASHNTTFWKMIGAKNLDEAVAFITKHCGVEMLRSIDDTPEAIVKWQELDNQSQAPAPTP